jgi:hypothetical protein
VLALATLRAQKVLVRLVLLAVVTLTVLATVLAMGTPGSGDTLPNARIASIATGFA